MGSGRGAVLEKRSVSGAAQAEESATDPMRLLGLSPALVGILRYFVLRPDAEPRLRELQRLLGLSSASTQRELARMVALGALERRVRGREVRYVAVTTPDAQKVWRVLRTLVRDLSAPVTLVQEALRDVPGIEAGFVFGSEARGAARPDSDVDVLVVGDAIDTRAMHRRLVEAALLMGREINPLRYSRAQFAERLRSGAGFVRDVLRGPKAWVAGSAAALPSLPHA